MALKSNYNLHRPTLHFFLFMYCGHININYIINKTYMISPITNILFHPKPTFNSNKKKSIFVMRYHRVTITPKTYGGLQLEIGMLEE